MRALSVYRRPFRQPPPLRWAPPVAAVAPPAVSANHARFERPPVERWAKRWDAHRARLAAATRWLPAIFVPGPVAYPRPARPQIERWARQWDRHRARLAATQRYAPSVTPAAPAVPTLVYPRLNRVQAERWIEREWRPHRVRLAKLRPYWPRWTEPTVAPEAPTTPATGAVTRGATMYAAEIDVFDTVNGVEDTLCVVGKSTRRGLNTRADDSPASRHFRPYLEEFNAAIHAYGPGKIGGAPQVVDGRLRIENLDGKFDYARAFAFTGRDVRVKRGVDGARYSLWSRIFTGATVAQPPFDFDAAQFTLRPASWVLTQQLQRRTYLGSGGDEGDASNEGKVKPKIFGKCNNITAAQPVGASSGTYQANDGRASDIEGTSNDELGFTNNSTPNVEGAAPRNEITYSSDLSNAAWTKATMTTALVAGVDDGAATATRLTASAANATATRTLSFAGKSVLLSFYARRVIGTGAVTARFDGASANTLILTSSWKRFYYRVTAPTEFRIEIATSGDAIDIMWCLVETPDPLFPSYPITTTSTAPVQDYRFTPAGIARQILCQCVGVVPFVDIDEDSFDALDALSVIPAPTTACGDALAGAGAGNVDNGTHYYQVTFVTAEGETTVSPTSDGVTVVNLATNGRVSLTAIPTGGSQVTSRKIYRTKVADATAFFLVTTIADNTTTTYQDNTADASLGAAPPSTNSTRLKTGVAVTDKTSAAEAIHAVLDSIGAFLFVEPGTGLYTVKRLDAPAAVADVTLPPRRIMTGACKELEVRPPAWRVTLGYQRDWSVTANATGSVARDARAARLSATPGEYRAVDADDTGVRDIWGEVENTDIEKLTLLDDRLTAQAECDRVHALIKVRRQFLEIVTDLEPGTVRIGDTIEVTYPGITYDRRGSVASKRYFVTGLQFDYRLSGGDVDETLTIQCWG